MAAGAVVALSVAMAPAVGAQSDETLRAVGESFCALFTQEEVDAIAGGPGEEMPEQMVRSPRDASCRWTLDPEGAGSLTAGWDERSLEAIRTSMFDSDGTDVTVGGQPGWLAISALRERDLYLELGPATLHLRINHTTWPEDLDPESELLRLGELALGRLDGLLPEPRPSYVERLIPATVGDQAMRVSSLRPGTLPDDHPILLALTSAAAEQGRAPADVTWTSGDIDDGTGLVGVRIYGADASAFAEPLTRALLAAADVFDWDGSMSPGSVAGKDVLVVPLGESAPAPWHVYARDDIAWVVSAHDQALTAILEALP